MMMDNSANENNSNSEEIVRSWFESAVLYEGLGRAEFEDPHGYVTGPASVEFTESGIARGELRVENLLADEPLPLGVYQLFQRDRPTPGEEPGSLVLSFGLTSKSND